MRRESLDGARKVHTPHAPNGQDVATKPRETGGAVVDSPHF